MRFLKSIPRMALDPGQDVFQRGSGLRPWSLAVYADRRTMPNEQVYANVFHDIAVAGSA